jgi:dihydroxyacetone kinase-like protein
MGGVKNKDGKPILLKMVVEIQKNKDDFGEIDGLIGDGDHGMNMNKGFSLFGEAIANKDLSFTEGLDELGMLLMSKIGGSMGPIYGSLFTGMAEAGGGLESINTAAFSAMINAGLKGLHEVTEAQVGDKTLADTLIPAKETLQKAAREGKSLAEALTAMKAAAAGCASTRDMAAKLGRSSRLGERSRGVLDAGAVSCNILLSAMADAMLDLLGNGS